jgi:hypothetical protein
MPTITVKLDKKRADRLARWARRSKIPKSEVIRALIDRAGPIETGEDLIEWVDAAAGKAWAWHRESRESAGLPRHVLSDRVGA